MVSNIPRIKRDFTENSFVRRARLSPDVRDIGERAGHFPLGAIFLMLLCCAAGALSFPLGEQRGLAGGGQFLKRSSVLDTVEAQCIFRGTVRIDWNIPAAETDTPRVQLLRKDLSFVRDAHYSSANGTYGVSAFAVKDGFHDGERVVFRVIYQGDSIIARTVHDLPVFVGTALPNPPDNGSLRTVDLSNNHPPVITSLPISEAREDSVYVCQVVATDRDTDALSFSLINSPGWLSIEPDGRIHGIPGAAAVGDTGVTVKVSDGFFGGTVTQTYSLHVIHTNHPPAAFHLLEPVKNDTTVKSTFIVFTWRASSDVDARDTIEYTLHLTGPGPIDTAIAGIKDTSLEVNIVGLQSHSTYEWSVAATDGIAGTPSIETFTFATGIVTGIGEHDGHADLPPKYALGQNYPNPFNPTTEFGFRIPARPAGGVDCSAAGGSASGGVFVSLKVYDVLGREVATLVNEVKQPGEYVVQWDARPAVGGMPSGVYFYRIEARPIPASRDERARTFVETKRLLLMK